MLRHLFIAAALLAATPIAVAQATPEATLARFVKLANAGELTSPEGKAILTGEARDMATGAKSALPAAERVIKIGANKAAARFVLRGPDGQEADAYFYLEKTAQGWAVSAFRSMGASAIDMMLLTELNKRKTLTPEEAIEKRNLELMLSTDSQLRKWFATNRATLDALASAQPGADAQKRARELGFASISVEGKKADFVIGGGTDNKVGFLRPGAAAVPTIDPRAFIWVEDLGNGWFLYRTT